MSRIRSVASVAYATIAPLLPHRHDGCVRLDTAVERVQGGDDRAGLPCRPEGNVSEEAVRYYCHVERISGSIRGNPAGVAGMAKSARRRG